MFNTILWSALKSASRSRIYLSFLTLIFPGVFSNTMDRPLSYLTRGVEFLIAKLINEHLTSKTSKSIA